MEKITILSDVKYAEPAECLLDIYVKPGATKTLIWLHGGGLIHFNKTTDRDFLLKTANDLNMHIVSADYRKYKTAKFPEFIEDAAAAVAFVFEYREKYALGGDIFLGGSSAGAYLAMMVLFNDKYLQKHGLKPTDLKGFILDSPQTTDHFNVLLERGIDTRKVLISDASPLYFAEEKPYPPFFITSYENDIFGRLEQNKMACKLFEALQIPFTFLLMQGAHTAGVNLNEKNEYTILDPLKSWINAIK